MSQLISRPYWYLRHGETDWNRQGLAQGSTDIPLNATGEQQAVLAGKALADLFRSGQKPFSRILSSPLTRALTTAKTVQAMIEEACALRVPLEVNDELREVCFGVQEGTLMGDWYKPWIEEGFVPQDAESFHALTARAARAVNTILNSPETPLIVAHGALFRGLRSAMQLPVDVRLPNAVPLALTPNKQTGWDIEIIPLQAARI
ncbi:histidine phosphatase family protein [Gluconobacter kanchanaburiensis]|uniref:Phosphoglycerate mutase n=1 Tax=Gluconobacter kanchanaburiensis NBRC 103587 TaxID=1307948 RepID=A0A511B7G7_9PROT|nr:histidine phosphatase family protein [Gluconobacter kanchanaburiensis]MBF0861862.1 histidine phosphatase family protein [Gluconobacter kanchanaburiensis]GBR67911.1 phosphoglycerate mutase [Gluconobacter kanchanaburiensis NBRC 103587]GEK95612.1 hypothetical protein GKA01_08090 [Gluconobacter kanchanaburiensis NBRC 103587]